MRAARAVSGPGAPGRSTDRLARFPLGGELEAFWRDPAHRDVESWRAHEDINDVMLATSPARRRWSELARPLLHSIVWTRHASASSMVEQQILARGVRDPRVLAAMGAVPRGSLPAARARGVCLRRSAAADRGRPDSLSRIVALMAEALRLQPDDDVLEIGAGLGYAAAVLAEVARRVYTIERHAMLADLARAARAARLRQRRGSLRRWHARLARARAVRRDRRRRRP